MFRSTIKALSVMTLLVGASTVAGCAAEAADDDDLAWGEEDAEAEEVGSTSEALSVAKPACIQLIVKGTSLTGHLVATNQCGVRKSIRLIRANGASACTSLANGEKKLWLWVRPSRPVRVSFC
jgi:hypothetical protein